MNIKLDIGNVLKGVVGYFWGNDKNWHNDSHMIKYVVSKNGLFEIHDTEILMAVAKPVEVRGMDDTLSEGIIMKTPKIPNELYYTILKFLRTVYLRDKTEATIHCFWDREKQEYLLWVPKQENAAAASTYERDKDKEFTQMCDQYVWVMTTHSHPTFAGNFSGIDDADEKDTRLFMVVGQIMNEVQDISLRTMVNGKPVPLKFYDVFTNPYDEIGEVPAEWLARCKPKAQTTKVYGGYATRDNRYADYNYWGYESYRDYPKYGGRGSGYSSSKDDLLDERYSRNQYGIIGMEDIPPEDIVSDNPSVVNAIALNEFYSSEQKKTVSIADIVKARAGNQTNEPAKPDLKLLQKATKDLTAKSDK